MDAYERVLGDAMHGDATLFAREDYVEEAWRIVDPALRSGTPVDATIIDAVTMIGDNVLGRICRVMIRQGDCPETTAASTNSRERRLST